MSLSVKGVTVAAPSRSASAMQACVSRSTPACWPAGSLLIRVYTAARIPLNYRWWYHPNILRLQPHLHTVHAIAMLQRRRRSRWACSWEATVPTSHRWIPKSMNVQYLEKATTSLRAHAQLDPPEFTSITDGAEIVVPVGVVTTASRWCTPTSPAG